MEGSNRRVSKPLMEKRRRARINQSLAELKGLIMDDIKSKSPRHSKLEKADILEMAVKHLKELHKQRRIASILSRETVRNKFRAGYEECINEIENFFSAFERPTSTTVNDNEKEYANATTRPTETRQRILRFLGDKLDRLNAAKKQDRETDSDPITFADRPGMVVDSSGSRSCFCSRVSSLRLLLVPSEYGNGEHEVIGVSSTNEIDDCKDKSPSQSPRPTRPQSSMSGNSAGFSSVVSSSQSEESSSSDECDRVQFRDKLDDVEMGQMIADPVWRPW